jgi:hypothetical protein
MKLTFNHGWFPDQIIDGSLVASPQGVAVGSYTIAQLCQLFWLAKSYDWSIAVNYNLTGPDGYGNDAGTVTGSGTNLVQTPDTFGSSTSSLPAERVLPIGQTGTQGFPASSGAPYGGQGNYTSAGDGYSHAGSFAFTWFNGQRIPGNDFYLTQSGLAYTAWFSLDTAILAGGPLQEQLSLNPDGQATGINIVLKLTGAPDVLIPLYANFGLAVAREYTGAITIDFNTFWTP